MMPDDPIETEPAEPEPKNDPVEEPEDDQG